MCGGTHVKNTQEIGGVVVTKMKKVCQYIILYYYWPYNVVSLQN